MLRAAVKNETPIGLEAKAYMDRGELVPDEVVIGIVKERLSLSDAEGGYILDGFPRTLAQAEALSNVTKVTKAINIAVEDEKLVKRLSGRRVCMKCGYTGHLDYDPDEICPKCGDKLIQRDDDKPDTIRNRLAVYNKSTLPLIEYYQGLGVLEELDGYRSIDAVYIDVMRVLGVQ